MDDFTITNIQWHIKRIGSDIPINELIAQYSVFARFMEQHGLLTRKVTDQNGNIDTSFKLMRSDVTDLGFKFCQTGYQKYLQSLDRGTGLDKAQDILMKYLDKITKA